MKRRRFVNPASGGIPHEVFETMLRAQKELEAAGLDIVVIGGCALAFHFPAYVTDDVDFAVQENILLPEKP